MRPGNFTVVQPSHSTHVELVFIIFGAEKRPFNRIFYILLGVSEPYSPNGFRGIKGSFSELKGSFSEN